MANKTYPARRSEPRKELRPLEISKMSSLENHTKICNGGVLIEASVSGFKLMIGWEQLVPIELRKNLSLESLVGQAVLIHLSDLNLEVSGRIARTRFVGKKKFELGIDYSEDAPEYWRECLVDLLPRPGELEEN